MNSDLQPLERAQLREFLVDRFSQDELERLAFDLGVDYELFRYQNKSRLSLELIANFERHNRLGCLLQEIARLRPDHNWSHLVQKVSPCIRHTKIQIVTHASQEIHDEIEAFLALLAQKHRLSRQEVNLIAVAQGSLYLLISLPHDVVEARQWVYEPHLETHPFSLSIFNELPERSQKIWRMVACEWPPIPVHDRLLPRISWQKADELFQLKQKDELLRLLVSGSEFGAHGTRVSLAALSGYAQLLALVGDLNDKQANYVEKLGKASEDLSESLTVLHNLISSRVEEVTVQFLLQHVLTTITPIIEQTGLSLDLAFEEEVARSQQLIRGNAILLAKSVAALILNCTLYSPANGRIQLTASLKKDHLFIQVQDMGESVPADAAARIFALNGERPFAQTNHQSRVSSGLGLSLTKLVIEQLEGKVWLEPEQGIGNLFNLLIPFAKQPDG